MLANWLLFYWLTLTFMIMCTFIIVDSFIRRSTQCDVKFYQFLIIHLGNMVVGSVMNNTPMKHWSSIVVVFLYNIEYAVTKNLALRNIVPSFIEVDLNNLHYFDSQTQIGFILMNCCLFHDIKWLLFLNGPIYIVGSYFQIQFWADETLRLTPETNVNGYVQDSLIIVITIFAVITFSHYMQHKDLSVLIIEKYMLAQQ